MNNPELLLLLSVIARHFRLYSLELVLALGLRKIVERGKTISEGHNERNRATYNPTTRANLVLEFSFHPKPEPCERLC
jgi:hypothetical protein